MSLVLLSGGLDSGVLLAREAKSGSAPRCLAVDYGQRHRKELDHANRLAEHYGASLTTLELPAGLLAGSALTGTGDIPHGHFEDPIQDQTVVPNRNMLLLSLAITHAIQHGETWVLFAAHKGDAAIYLDCRETFVRRMDDASRFAWGVRIVAPFLSMAKRDIVQLGRSIAFPFDLTWSCYEGGEMPCGLCGACVERTEAMA